MVTAAPGDRARGPQIPNVKAMGWIIIIIIINANNHHQHLVYPLHAAGDEVVAEDENEEDPPVLHVLVTRLLLRCLTLVHSLLRGRLVEAGHLQVGEVESEVVW